MYLLKKFFHNTPKDLLISFHGKNEKTEEHKQEPGFFEGLRLLVTHKYLLGIFCVIAFPELITTIIDLHFNSLAAAQYSGTQLAEYLGVYGSAVNIVALAFLLLGVGNITRLFGVGVSLFLMPVIYGLAMFGFITLNSLNFLFILMVSSKAINYALNGPAIKQLYIPTTHDVRFKSQAWMLLGPLQGTLGKVAGAARHAVLASYLSFSIIFVWFFITVFLGRKYKHAIDQDKVVC
jgi:AAA family ATP:ADP antiporter